MKTIVIFFAFLAVSMSAGAQKTYVSSEQRQTCYWEPTTSKFSVCNEMETFECLFTLNADETMFVHTTAALKSSYYVKSKTYNADADVYTYDVVSDVGNKYQFITSKSAANFVILSTGHTDPKDDYIMKFPVKKRWND